MDSLIRISIPLLFFSATGWLFLAFLPHTHARFNLWIDRMLLCFILGMGFYPLFFLVAQGLTGLPLNRGTVIGVFLTLLLVSKGYTQFRSPSPSAEKHPPDPLTNFMILTALAVLFYCALDARLQNTLAFPGQLLDSDPYRHHVRTEALLRTGHLSKWDPYIIGEVPIYELQGCYVLAAVISLLSGFSAQALWRIGAPMLGAFSVLPVYLLCKYSLSHYLEEGVVGKAHPHSTFGRNWVPTLVGLIAVGLLAASPIHLLRTNAGFSEAFALPFFAPAILFYLFFIHDPRIEWAVLFGLLFTVLSINNPVPAVYLVPLFFVHSLYYFLKTRHMTLVYGILASAGIFLLTMLIWTQSFLGVPWKVGLWANSDVATQGLNQALHLKASLWDRLKNCFLLFFSEVGRNISYVQLILGGLGAVWILREKKKWQLEATSSFYLLFYFLYFLLIFLIPLGIPSFTSKYYRNFLPASYAVAILSAYFLYRVSSLLFEKRPWREILLLLFLAGSVNTAARAATWGGWVLDCSPEEYQAAEWINKNTTPQAMIISNWYTNDFLRSLTLRRTLLCPEARSIVKYGMERSGIQIPVLKQEAAGILSYVDQHPGEYYLIASIGGPGGNYEGNPRFKKMAEFGGGKKTMTRIYKIL